MAIREASDDPVALALITLLGCPKNVRRIEYVAALGEATRVTVTYLPDIAQDAGRELLQVTKNFKLVPRD